MLTVERLTKSFGSLVAVDTVTFAAPAQAEVTATTTGSAQRR